MRLHSPRFALSLSLHSIKHVGTLGPNKLELAIQQKHHDISTQLRPPALPHHNSSSPQIQVYLTCCTPPEGHPGA